MRSRFVEGYRRHLDWHRQHDDPLAWYGWFVSSGERVGLFIDGSFGAPYAAFDHRVNPTGDRANAAQNVAPFVDPAFRSTYVLRPTLSTGRLLEEHEPSPSIQVVYYTLRPGMQHRFEEALAELRAVLDRAEDPPVYTWYQLIVGGEHPAFMLMIPRYGWADYATGAAIRAIVRRAFEPEEAAALLKMMLGAVEDVRSEVWSYREDLSYFPNREASQAN